MTHVFARKTVFKASNWQKELQYNDREASRDRGPPKLVGELTVDGGAVHAPIEKEVWAEEPAKSMLRPRKAKSQG